MAVGVQWHQLFDEAQCRSDVVSVARTVADYIGRAPTRSEITAARRAAASYARSSNAQVIHVLGTANNGGERRFLLLARVDADLDNLERLHAVASGDVGAPVRRRTGANGPQVTESLAGRVVRAAHQA